MDLHDLKKEFDKTGVVICFNGMFYQGIIEEVGKAVRNHLAAAHTHNGIYMDVFAVYIEMTQNVHNYFTSRGITRPEITSSIITIGRNGEEYRVTSGNIVQNQDLEALCLRIDEVNALSHDEIKSRFRSQLRRDVAPRQLGAGLGMLEIAKRSSGKMSYAVKDFDATGKFFILSAQI